MVSDRWGKIINYPLTTMFIAKAKPIAYDLKTGDEFLNSQTTTIYKVIDSYPEYVKAIDLNGNTSTFTYQELISQGCTHRA